ncbi:MAG TPA: LamG-like jellyroll fold domain-containing protein [Gaiellaceae bacterium]|nr:LamG-like jellyroll fold domain-containing protein [Gaiellaceae bacterium]
MLRRPSPILVAAALCASLVIAGSDSASASTPQPSFQDQVVFSGLTNPTAVQFSPDGRVFVAEKSGRVLVYDGLADPTPTLFVDLSTNVHNFWDRGLLGLALHPDFPATPYVYVLYAHDAAIGGIAPRWGTPGVLSDPCPTPPGATADGCVVSGRLSRLTASGNVATGGEQVLIEDWCQQYPSHSIGDLAFGADGALYVSGGDGASFNFTDWGQDGSPVNPCGDPPGGPGSNLSPPTAEGGALRSQDVRTTADPTSLDGAVLRVDPITGAGLPTNPFAFSSDPNARRIVAHGFRNPFRIGIRPGTSDVWVGDVGWNDWEEIDRLGDTADLVADNFGWPCYEGVGTQGGYDGANLNLCESLYAAGTGAVRAPVYTYNHSAKVVSGETCPTGGSSVSGIAFYDGGNYPSSYANALFFADYSRSCIWAMRAGAGGLPDPTQRVTFVAAAAGPVDVEIGPAGDLFYVDLDGGTIHRIRYLAANQAPTAAISATPTSAPLPMTVSFDGTGSSDPEGGPLTYAWDLDGDGAYDDSTSATPTWTYTTGGTVRVRLRVTDPQGATADDLAVLEPGGNTGPTPTIATPTAATTWKVGDVISFSGSATDPQDGTIPASGLTWTLVMQHCPSNCHSHTIQQFAGVSSGSFTAPDHEYPSYLELRLTATDSGGLNATTTVRLDPRTVALTFASSPAGLDLVVGPTQETAPFTRTVIVGSSNTVSAPSPQTLGGTDYSFSSWSDGGAATHTLVAPATATTYTATYTTGGPPPPPAGLVAAYGFDAGSGTTAADATGKGHTGTINGPTWVTTGRYGNALSFDGVNDIVTVADANDLDLTTGMTLEAWVNPAALGNSWRTVLMKEQTGDMTYDLYAHGGGGASKVPTGEAFVAGSPLSALGTSALALNTWTHLALTFDGSALRLYVNGAAAATALRGGAMATSTGALRIGGNTIWSEWFSGRIDEVRVYNRALTQTEIQADMAAPVGTPAPPDTSPPTAPGTPTASVAGGDVSLAWGAATDDVGVVRYDVHRATTTGFTPSAANRIAQPTTTSYTDPGLAPGTYYYKVVAADAAGNLGPASGEASATVTTPPPPPPPTGGLVAAWSFDAGSGTTAADATGKGHTGTINGPTWVTTGRYGNALSFDGVNDIVTVADANDLDLTTGMTLEAWVNPAALGNSWRTVLMKEQTGNIVYDLYAHGSGASKLPTGEAFAGGSVASVAATSALALNAWAHLAVTYDGSALRLYVNGTLAGTTLRTGSIATSTGALRIGGNTIWSEWFSGRIDEMRVYNRALTQAEIQTDMTTPVGPPAAPDTTPPSAPGTLSATPAGTAVSLAWGAATDDVGVVRYDVHRATTTGFTPSAANRIAQPTTTSYTDPGLAPGTYDYKVVAADAAGNLGPASNEASATVVSDTTPPTVQITAPTGGSTVSGTITVAASAADNLGVAGVRFTVDGAQVGSEDTTAPYEVSWATGTATNGLHTLRAIARDAAGNTTTSADVVVTVSNVAPPPPTGLVAAYGFEAGAGTTVADASGNGHAGTISGPLWVTTGRYGNALSFDGVNDWVTIPDANDLDLATGMTLEAWVRPTTVSGSWRTVLLKEAGGTMAYALYAAADTGAPSGHVVTGGTERILRGSSTLPTAAWSHLAVTYDGSALRLYVGGTQVATSAVAGTVDASTGVLRIGGNNIWPEWFSGLIDEVRVYNRALSQAEIQTDSTTPVGS